MANNRNIPYDDLWSSDDSNDDDYNYLTALDNINWNTRQNNITPSSGVHPRPLEHRNVARNGSKPASRIKPTAKPAVAVKSKANRNDFLLKDMMASEKDKTKDMPNNDNQNANRKRGIDLVEANEAIDDIVVFPNDNAVKHNQINNNNNYNNNNNNKSENILAKNKKPKVDVNSTEHNIHKVLEQKKSNHAKSVSNNIKSDINRVKNDRVFGKAFSPTVYSPEVPVLKHAAPLTSNVNLTHKALTFSEENPSADNRYSPKAFRAIILDWNAKWLQECNSNEVPNLLSPFGEGIGMKTSYESLEEYQQAYIPLILFETWAQIHKDFYGERQFEFESVRGPDIQSDEHFMIISLLTVCPGNRTKLYPSEGSLLLLELTILHGADNDERKVILFGYVTDFRCDKVSPDMTLPHGLSAPPAHSNPVLLRFIVELGKKPIRFSNQIIKAKGIHYLKPTIRQIELISNLNSSPLLKDILKPRAFTCQVVVPTNISTTSPNFNESQNKAILGSYEALNRTYAVPKLLFIQGPPGTGKTHTLIGIIKHLYNQCEEDQKLPRILICAPSNGAVDEISRRLHSERNFLARHKYKKHQRALRCVRVGKESQIHPEVRKMLYETLIRENVENELKRYKEQNEESVKKLENKMIKLDQQIANLRATRNLDELRKAEKESENLVFQLQKLSSNPKTEMQNSSKKRLRMEIMIKADIVLSTLNSVRSAPIDKLFKDLQSKTFDCVIVDEASQCSEPELLMPLAYRMTKMILIGDPMQLPATIISKKASSLGLGRSLFERFFHYFRECEMKDSSQKSPVLMLTEQYRMHPQICHFPSHHFYDGRLISSSKVVKERESKLKPYIVFDVTDSIENRSDPTNKYNELEANFVIRLLSLIDQMLELTKGHPQKFSVGVITPYNGQKNHLTQKLNERVFKTINVEVNTVDGFQGQERDIILLSAVRAFDNQSNSNKWQSIGFLDSVQRMNVALTRAKYSMILCISGRSLETDKNWKALIEDAIRRANCRFKVPSTLVDDTIRKMLAAVETISIVD